MEQNKSPETIQEERERWLPGQRGVVLGLQFGRPARVVAEVKDAKDVVTVACAQEAREVAEYGTEMMRWIAHNIPPANWPTGLRAQLVKAEMLAVRIAQPTPVADAATKMVSTK